MSSNDNIFSIKKAYKCICRQSFEGIDISEDYSNAVEGWMADHHHRSLYERLKRVAGGRLTDTLKVYARQRVVNALTKMHHSVRGNTFRMGSKEYHYYTGNFALLHERTVEMAIAKQFYDDNRHGTVLEVGNVMHQCMPIPEGYDIVDKYEPGGGVINEDIVDYKPGKRYDMIISVSTMEHVGYEEPDRVPYKSLVGIRKGMKMLKPGGKMLITVPLGMNPAIDGMIMGQGIKFTRSYFLKRISYWNYWALTDAKDAISLSPNSRYPGANSIAVLIKG